MIVQKKNFILAFVVLTGAFFCCSNTVFSYLPKNVQINGVSVGKMQREKAVDLIRSEIAKNTPTLTVHTPCGQYDFSYPEIGFFDDLESIVKKAKRNHSYTCIVKYYLKAEDVVINNICAACSIKPVSAYAEFDGTFSYQAELFGRECDRAKLKKDIQSAMNGDFNEITLSCYEKEPKKTLWQVKEETQYLGGFTTYFDGENVDRAHNVALAGNSVNGTKVEAGEEFSFNRIVGARTAERGYRQAKIIKNGKFVNGIGGGVCQTSTTVYNAALLSGMAVTSVQAHSLSVAYVEPSFDAMVSSSSDLTFVNPYQTPVYIGVKTGTNFITVNFYGKPSGLTYKRVSEVIDVIPPKEEIVEQGDEDKVLISAKNGLKSRASLYIYKNGELTSNITLRTDTYGSVRGVRLVKKQEREEKLTE